MKRKTSSTAMGNRIGQGLGCNCPNAHDVPLSGAGFDAFEQAALEIIRHICLTMAPRPARPGDPFGIAQELFSGVEGAHLGAALTAFVQTMAMGRSANFKFSNPYCRGCAARLTDSERHLLLVLRAVRRGHWGVATAHAAMLCDRGPVDGLLSAAADVAAWAPLPVCTQ